MKWSDGQSLIAQVKEKDSNLRKETGIGIKTWNSQSVNFDWLK